MVEAFCAPGSFSEHESTVFKDDPVDGEPDVPEWRISTGSDDNIWRQTDESNIVVTAVVFVTVDFFDMIGDGDKQIAYNTASELLHS